jgi:hypothetical protein
MKMLISTKNMQIFMLGIVHGRPTTLASKKHSRDRD